MTGRIPLVGVEIPWCTRETVSAPPRLNGAPVANYSGKGSNEKRAPTVLQHGGEDEEAILNAASTRAGAFVART
jgi:hypothetical protein